MDYNHSRALESAHPLAWSLIISFLLHLLLVLVFTIEQKIEVRKPIVVSLKTIEQDAVKQSARKQIVSPSQTEDKTLPRDTPFVSENDSFARVETLRRGIEDATGTEGIEKSSKGLAPPPAKVVSKTTTSPKAKKDAVLRLDDQVLASTFGDIPVNTKEQTKKDKPREQSPEEALEELLKSNRVMKQQPFVKQSPAIALTGKFGSSDHLPQIPDGDITLLNAKADRFAVFVRRVALQVFGALRRTSWREIPLRQISEIRGFSTIHAVMSPQGKLINVKIVSSSGSTLFDQVVNTAAEQGTWDQNPPKGVHATDGNIHFVFQARTWGQMRPEGLGERRWLLLGTGLL